MSTNQVFSDDTVAVIVTYNPDLDTIRQMPGITVRSMRRGDHRQWLKRSLVSRLEVTGLGVWLCRTDMP